MKSFEFFIKAQMTYLPCLIHMLCQKQLPFFCGLPVKRWPCLGLEKLLTPCFRKVTEHIVSQKYISSVIYIINCCIQSEEHNVIRWIKRHRKTIIFNMSAHTHTHTHTHTGLPFDIPSEWLQTCPSPV